MLFWPKLLPRAMSVPVVKLQLGFVLMSIACVPLGGYRSHA